MEVVFFSMEVEVDETERDKGVDDGQGVGDDATEWEKIETSCQGARLLIYIWQIYIWHQLRGLT